ncbi:helix-turn-helix domain-containing protein [Brassicibacter mesophilus]|uniref:helix-turn-helix domain-containing protein n=1 Tax=Brassicibacter mesophilus TaxID=745119 RepID=UPI003D1F59AF
MQHNHRGKKGGRPAKSNQDIDLTFKMYDSKEYSISDISKATGVSKTSLSAYIDT